MFQTVTYNSSANRFAPHSDYVDFEGFDFSGATAKIQVRDRKNGGALRADIVPTFALLPEAETVTTRMAWLISEAAMEAMPIGAEVDDDVVLYFDCHLTPSGGVKFVPFKGIFIVKAGVTE